MIDGDSVTDGDDVADDDTEKDTEEVADGDIDAVVDMDAVVDSRSFTVPDSSVCTLDEPSTANTIAFTVSTPPVGTSVAVTTTEKGAVLTVPDVVAYSFTKVTRAMVGPLTCSTVTVLGFTLSITNGDVNAGAMVMLVCGPELSIRTSFRASMTVAPTVAATVMRYVSDVAYDDTSTNKR